MAEDPAAAPSDLDADVRRVDEARWLASRFAPTAARKRLVALYAFNHEIARVRETVSDPLVGEIRLAWWREAIGEIYDDPGDASGRIRRHPIVLALADALVDRATRPARALFDGLIDARTRDLDERRFADMAELEAYATATAGGLMKIAVRLVGGEQVADDAGLDAAGRAWSLAGLARAFPVHARQGWVVIPDAPSGDQIERLLTAQDGAAVRSLVQPLVESAHAALAAARKLSAAPARLWPAYGYVALAPSQLRALASDPFALATRPAGLADRVRLVLAAARGGI